MSTDFTDYEKIKKRHTDGNGHDLEDWNEPPADLCVSLQQWIERGPNLAIEQLAGHTGSTLDRSDDNS